MLLITSIHMSNIEDWYFDSGCSCHMTGNSLLFTKINECRTGRVTFGDGVKGIVVGKGEINQTGVPKHTNVRLVEGLSTNLLSIS